MTERPELAILKRFEEEDHGPVAMRPPTDINIERVEAQLREREAQNASVRAALPRLDWQALWDYEESEQWILYPLFRAALGCDDAGCLTLRRCRCLDQLG